jgi:7-cyano-7-deazaguanine synthase
MSKIIILASGGYDSSTLIAMYSALNYEVHVICFDYGNKNNEEESAYLTSVCDKYEVPYDNIHKVKISIPWSRSVCINSVPSGDQYVEMRNLIFVSYAISLAEALQIDLIALGLIKVPIPYSDTSEGFLNDIDTLSMRATGVKIIAPLHNMTKHEVYNLGRKFDLKFIDTFSCNTPVLGAPCGYCPDCLEILEIIKKEGVENVDNPLI